MATTASFKALTSSDIHQLIVAPVQQQSVALAVSTIASTNNVELRFPRVTSDPSAAWVPELGEIPVSDAETDEIVVRPAKIAGLTTISVELSQDASPDAARVVGDGLVRSIADQIDRAFFGATLPSPAPAGLRSLDDVTEVEAPEDWENVDPFEEAIASGEQNGSPITTFVTSPADALLLSLLKESAGSNRNLLQSDPTAAARRVIGGVPLLVSKHVAPGVAWGIPASHTFGVVRKDASVETSEHFLWRNHAISVRGVMRVGFGFPFEPGVVKISRDS